MPSPSVVWCTGGVGWGGGLDAGGSFDNRDVSSPCPHQQVTLRCTTLALPVLCTSIQPELTRRPPPTTTTTTTSGVQSVPAGHFQFYLRVYSSLSLFLQRTIRRKSLSRIPTYRHLPFLFFITRNERSHATMSTGAKKRIMKVPYHGFPDERGKRWGKRCGRRLTLEAGVWRVHE